jgi:hypothetical protein
VWDGLGEGATTSSSHGALLDCYSTISSRSLILEFWVRRDRRIRCRSESSHCSNQLSKFQGSCRPWESQGPENLHRGRCLLMAPMMGSKHQISLVNQRCARKGENSLHCCLPRLPSEPRELTRDIEIDVESQVFGVRRSTTKHALAFRRAQS